MTQYSTNNQADKPERRYYIDWLRVIIVLLLIPFHAARVFDTSETFYVQNEVLSSKLTFWWIFIGHSIGMETLFLLSGCATWFALRYRSAARYAKERFVKLLIPLVIGVLVIVPPISYYGKLANTWFRGSYIAYYPHFFDAPQSPEGYTGGFTLAHLWFVLFLFLISLLALPLFQYFESDSGKRVMDKLAGFFEKPGGIFLFAIPLIGLEQLIDLNKNSPVSPIFFFIFFLTLFIYGYILMTDNRYEQSILRHKKIALIFGPLLWFLIRGIQTVVPITGVWREIILHLFYRGTFPWLSMIAMLGYAKEILNFPNKFLLYFGKASYSIYILHQTVVVAAAYYVVQWDANILTKYTAITVITYGVTILTYEMFVRRIKFVRMLFGMKDRL